MNTTGVDCPHCGAADLTEHAEGCPNEPHERVTKVAEPKGGEVVIQPRGAFRDRGRCWLCGRPATGFVAFRDGAYSLCTSCDLYVQSLVHRVAHTCSVAAESLHP